MAGEPRDLGDNVQVGVPGVTAPGDLTKLPEEETPRGEPGVAHEVAPRDLGGNEALLRTPGERVTTTGAVDENRPSDIVATAGAGTAPGAGRGSRLLERQNVIVPGDRKHPETAGQQLAEDEELE